MLTGDSDPIDPEHDRFLGMDRDVSENAGVHEADLVCRVAPILFGESSDAAVAVADVDVDIVEIDVDEQPIFVEDG